jgi:hypothetical protein
MNIFWKIYNFVIENLAYVCQYIEDHKLHMPLDDLMNWL